MKSQRWLIRFSNRLLRGIYDEELYDEIEGDLVELYHHRLESKGKTKASWLYLWDAMLSIRNVGLQKKRKSISEFSINPIDMIRNIIKIAFRSILKDKAYTTINVLGLTIGITCSLFLTLYILDELSYDKYHKNGENIYRIISTIKEQDNTTTWAATQIPMAEELHDNYPEVKNVVRFINLQRNVYKYDQQEFYEDKFYMADSTVFDMFTYEFVKGDPATALNEPYTMVLTEKMAKKYFGNEDPIGRTLQSNKLQNQANQNFKITGVLKDVPHNSHFRFDALVSRNTRPGRTGGWDNFEVFTYVQLPEGYDPSKMKANLNKIVKEKVNPVFNQYKIAIDYNLQRITDIHLYSKIQDETEASGDISYIYIFAVVAVFMLIIACINYMNLATARSANRAREVGIRKVMGSQRIQIILQFMTESVVLTVLALVVSVSLIYSLLPSFNSLANKEIPFSFILQPAIAFSLLGIVVFVGILGGSYPALYLSGFNPVNVLKGKLSAKGGSIIFRKSLVIFQFTISIFMLISTLVVFDQLEYMRNKDLGFNKKQVVEITLSGRALQRRTAALVEKLKQNSDVETVGTSSAAPGQNLAKTIMTVEENDGHMDSRGVNFYSADFDYVKTMEMKIVKGRDFSREFVSDTSDAVMVNEAMVKRMGWKDPLDKKITTDILNSDSVKHVVGVVKDYHQNSLYDAIEPLVIIMQSSAGNGNVFVRTKEGDVRHSLASIEQEWKEINPNTPFEYKFLDQDFDSQYKADEKRSQIFTTFSALTIVIACLGLLGLVSFTTEQRTKEIGVRKISGASVNGLVVLVSKEFFALVGIGMLLAFPLTYYFTDTWLQNFAYRIELKGEWLAILVSAVMAFVITMLTVGYHVIKAARANPVNSLRNQ